ncbi:hypothetical protein NF673_09740 [Pseudomonas moraviensis]|uniref:hypothetical protein n=1 Tax=Pseudomonas moraviensis TaxID=321662 RepID=UPI002092041B|nr:hypothetical protein [Pseudomonas moraviensis]UST66011.1 hypothetical protein NF673_09740 [Pseudomonas moraviensis]
MDYGFRSRNGSNFFQIDSENKVLNVAASGSYAIGKTPASPTTITTAVITYSSPITTAEAPHVFLNPTNHGMYHTLIHSGGPGNWTGFAFKLHLMAPFNSTDCSGKWLVATFRSTSPPNEYDLRLRNAANEQLFVGADNLLVLTGFPINEGWSLDNRGGEVSGIYWSGCQMPWTGSYEDYFLASTLLGGKINNGNTILETPCGFHAGVRSTLNGYVGAMVSSEGGTAKNGRTTFAARPMRTL